MTKALKSASLFNLIWLLSYISIASISAAIITPALPVIQLEYALSLGSVEWLISIFLIGYVLGQLIYAPLANQFGRLKALRIGLIINLVGIVICMIAPVGQAFWLLMFGRLITALGAASGLVCTFMLINEWLPESQRKEALAYSVLSFALGVGVAVMLGGLITDYWYWQGCFWFLLVHGFIMLLGTWLFSETLITPKQMNILMIINDYYAAFTSTKLFVFSLVVGYCSAVSYCFSAAGPQIAHTILTLSPSRYGYWNGINIIGIVLGSIFSKQLMGRISVSQLITVGFIGLAIGIVNLFTIWWIGSHSALWFFISSSSLYLFSSFLYAGGAFVASNALDDKANAAAMMSFVNMCFATISVILMGYLFSNPLLSFAIILSAIWVLVAGLVFIRRCHR